MANLTNNIEIDYDLIISEKQNQLEILKDYGFTKTLESWGGIIDCPVWVKGNTSISWNEDVEKFSIITKVDITDEGLDIIDVLNRTNIEGVTKFLNICTELYFITETK